MNPSSIWVYKEKTRKKNINILNQVIQQLEFFTLDHEAPSYTPVGYVKCSEDSSVDSYNDQWIKVSNRRRYQHYTPKHQTLTSTSTYYDTLYNDNDDMEEEDLCYYSDISSVNSVTKDEKNTKSKPQASKRKDNSVKEMSTDKSKKNLRVNKKDLWESFDIQMFSKCVEYYEKVYGKNNNEIELSREVPIVNSSIKSNDMQATNSNEEKSKNSDTDRKSDDGYIHCDNSDDSNWGYKTHYRESCADDNSNDSKYGYHSLNGKTDMDGRQKIFNGEIEILSESSREGYACREIDEMEDEFYQW